ncbi:hypothetical protein BHE74_00015880 [Ensete ventricosum]|nr:hypothetical protein BHE74_00015880 [Ensete ventricosum]
MVGAIASGQIAEYIGRKGSMVGNAEADICSSPSFFTQSFRFTSRLLFLFLSSQQPLSVKPQPPIDSSFVKSRPSKTEHRCCTHRQRRSHSRIRRFGFHSTSASTSLVW